MRVNPITATRNLARMVLGFTFRPLGIVLVLAVSTSLAADEAKPDRSWLPALEGFVDGLVTTGLDEHAVAGAVVVVVTSDDVLMSRGFRLSDVRTGARMRPETNVIPIASVTKVFTALAVLRLEQEGRLNLHDPIVDHLPELQLDQDFGEIRIAHLLGHTAGLEERFAGYFAEADEGQFASTLEQIQAVLPRQVRTPEEVVAYSNASYVLLGEIVARASGQPFHVYLEEAVLEPMGVDTAMFMHGAEPQQSASAYHVWDAGRFVAIDPAPFPEIHLPSGGLALTATDMGRLMQTLLHSGIPSQSDSALARAMIEMWEPMWPSRPAFSARTNAFWTEIWAGHTVYHHGGTHFGFHSNMVLIPDLDLAFFVAANGPSGGALMGLPRRALREVIAPGELPTLERSDCDATCLGEFAGRYVTARRNETGLDRLRVGSANAFTAEATEGGALLVSGLGHSRLFDAAGMDQFQTPEGDMRLGFWRSPDGRVGGAYVNGGLYVGFDRMTFWRSPASIELGLWAAVAGSLLCIGAAVASWRSKRRIRGVSFWLGATSIVVMVSMLAVLRAALDAPDWATRSAAGIELWALTALFAGWVVITLMSVVSLLSLRRQDKILSVERIALLASIPCFAWALITAWIWNLPTAAFSW